MNILNVVRNGFLLNLLGMVEFSDEEGYGRFLDLHEYYNQYLNIKV